MIMWMTYMIVTPVEIALKPKVEKLILNPSVILRVWFEKSERLSPIGAVSPTSTAGMFW